MPHRNTNTSHAAQAPFDHFVEINPSDMENLGFNSTHHNTVRDYSWDFLWTTGKSCGS